MSIFPTTRLHYAAADGCALLIREAIDKMDDETFQLYLKYHYATCERKDLTGITSHAIDIFQKQTTPPKQALKQANSNKEYSQRAVSFTPLAGKNQQTSKEQWVRGRRTGAGVNLERFAGT